MAACELPEIFYFLTTQISADLGRALGKYLAFHQSRTIEELDLFI